MGFFDQLFKKDPAAVLDRAEALLEDGGAYRALQLIQDVAETGELRERVVALESRCRVALADKALEEADFMEADGELEDALEWVRSALVQLERLGDQEERSEELRRRLKRLRAKVREAERQREMQGFLGRLADDDETDRGPDPLDLELKFGTLVGTLRDHAADRYLHRPLPFQQAYVDLNEGRLEEAEAAFDALLAEEPDDPVVRLERGRARLLAGNAFAAREDFEAAWPELGDDYLDQSGDLSVPLLWAEACLAGGDSSVVVDGLAGLSGYAAEEVTDDGNVAEVYGRALVAAGKLAEARKYLTEAVQQTGGRPDLVYHLARVLEQVGEAERSIAVLERSIAPSCTTGSCSKPPLHVPSTRMLARLYLDLMPEGGTPPERVGELLALIHQAQGGQATPADLRLLIRYQRAVGQTEEVAETEAALRRLEASGEVSTAGAPEPEEVGDAAVSWSSPSKPVL